MRSRSFLVVGALACAAACGGSGGAAREEASPPSTTSTTGVPATTTTTAPVDPALACIADLPVRQKVGQLVGVAVDGQSLATEGARIASLGAGTVLLQRPTTTGLGEAVAQFKAASTIPPLVAVDEEGGEVQHLRDVLGALPSPRQVASTSDPAAAEAMIAAHAEGMAGLGVDVVFGPVVDVGPVGGGGPLGDRVFGDDPALVTQYAQAYVAGFTQAGILPVIKHFPGHGAGAADSHDGPVGTPPIEELRRRDLLPYDTLLGEPVAVMVGHLNVPGLTGTTPASVSEDAINGLLRDEMGFAGLVYSDSLSMGAIASTRPPPQAAVSAVAAGADVALFVTIQDPVAVIDALEQAVLDGTIPAEQVDGSVARILTAKQIQPCQLETSNAGD